MDIPARIGKYQVQSVLGVGGMGTVYQCFDPDLKRLVAVKILNPEDRNTHDEAYRDRFIREAMTTARLQHPFIPPVYDVGRDENGKIYFVMKPIEGKSLERILFHLRQDHRKYVEDYDLFRLIEILRDVCLAISYAHNRGFIHRDLKPSNIFVGNYGEVYVIDWGLTKMVKTEPEEEKPNGSDFELPFPEVELDVDLIDSPITHTVIMAQTESSKENEKEVDLLTHTRLMDSISETEFIHPEDLPLSQSTELEDELTKNHETVTSRTLTMKGNILGTVYYMSPEQAEGSSETLGPEVDVYSLGVILYEILTLKLPVECDLVKDVIDKKISGDFESPEFRAVDRQIPPELAAAAMQALNPKVENRFQSVKEFFAALEYWLEGKIPYRRVSPSTFEIEDFLVFPKRSANSWLVQNNSITTQTLNSNKSSYLLYQNEFFGDVRFSTNFIAYPLDDDPEQIGEIVLLLNASVPERWRGYLDACSVHIGANRNTRAYISKNEVEVLSNEYLMLEPRRRYSLIVERTNKHIRVILNRQVIMFYYDSSPSAAFYFGFINKGENIVFSDVQIQSRGLPAKISAMEAPEALMAEKCYQGALKRFLAIAQGNKNRRDGAWACYRAGIASYLLNGDRKKAMRIWEQLKDSNFSIYEQLGQASLDLEDENPMKAADIIQKMLDREEPIPHLDPVADIVFMQAQQRLRQDPPTKEDWEIIDIWAKLALTLGQRQESKQSMTPSILWRWILLALTRFPDRLPDCIKFLRQIYGEGKSAFADALTTIDPLMTILKRSSGMRDHAFLMDKVMRLILNHDDNLGNLETLFRFYLNSGHLDVAEKISLHIYTLCRKARCDIPPAPIAFLACGAWLRNESNARELIQVMMGQSREWGPSDGNLLMGLDYYERGDNDRALSCWEKMADDDDSISYNRHFVAKGFLGELPLDPLEAGVPNRSDHRLLYYLFLGFKHYVDWRLWKKAESKQTASALLYNAIDLMRPSYDIYSATDIFARIPLENMGFKLAKNIKPEPLSAREKKWLDKLAVAAFAETTPKKRKSSTARGPKSRPKRTHNRK